MKINKIVTNNKIILESTILLKKKKYSKTMKKKRVLTKIQKVYSKIFPVWNLANTFELAKAKVDKPKGPTISMIPLSMVL